ncbi:MAG TPA: hypothetical protein VFP84_08530 [Kofleriaceae bacterium]|nr:hypothetical protein [Kofleriaceae bacterium]
MSDDAGDKKVKELLDAGTRADLERWFGLPSFEELAERGVKPAEPPPEDPEMLEVRKKRAEALAAVDPALVEAHRRRTEPPPDLIKFTPNLTLRVDPDFSTIDLQMIESQHTIAEPREVEISEDLRDDLHDCTPQALLRDLHRPELTFDKVFEIVDVAADQRLDIVATVAEAMRTRWTLPATGFGPSPLAQARGLIRELRDVRHSPWGEIKIPGR